MGLGLGFGFRVRIGSRVRVGFRVGVRIRLKVRQLGHARSTATLWSACAVRRWHRCSVTSCRTSLRCDCWHLRCSHNARCSLRSGLPG